MIFLDFLKAYDRISHAKLSYKLMDKCEDHPITRWIANYLSGCYKLIQLQEIHFQHC